MIVVGRRKEVVAIHRIDCQKCIGIDKIGSGRIEC